MFAFPAETGTGLTAVLVFGKKETASFILVRSCDGEEGRV